jgi:hypothetical protein
MSFTSDVNRLDISVSAAGTGTGTLQIRQDSPTGQTIATINVTDTDGQYKTVTVPVSSVKPGISEFYIVATAKPESLGNINVDWLRFHAGQNQ